VRCAVHTEADADDTCAVCGRGMCDACTAYLVDGHPSCAACGDREGERSRALGAAQLALVGVGYLATLAVSIVLFRPRPFVGGLAAVVAIALGRALQLWLRPPVVVRRPDARR
jgi:hypothetical protein